MGNKVSMIVPVYNVEAYVEDCLRSLTGQSYPWLEILLIDDGSKDGSGAVCDAWAARDSRVRVIHKANGGAASARNAGMDAATGGYLCFVDSDDVVEPEYVEHLVRSLEASGADAATCGFCFWSRSRMETRTGNTPPGIYGCEAFMERFLRDWSCSLLWNKIFRREVVGPIRMAEGHRVDDEFFTYQVCMRCARVAVTDRMLYRYRIRRSSAMQDMASVQEKIMLDRVAYVTARYRHICEKLPGLEEPYFLDALDTLTRYWHHSKDMPGAQRQIRAWVRSNTGRLMRRKLPLRQKAAYLRGLYLIRPAVSGEENSIQMDPQECFD